jgi:DNA-binding MarR family transcriptional regulator
MRTICLVGKSAADDRVEVWDVLRAAHARAKADISQDLLAAKGMQLAWFDVLNALHRAGGRLRMQELAMALTMNKSSLTRLVDRLDAAGLVAREPDVADGRGLHASLTRAGKDAYRSAKPTYLRLVQRHVGQPIDDTDVEPLTAGLRKLAAPTSR